MSKKEKIFKKALYKYLEKIVNTDFNSPLDARVVAAEHLQKIFSLNKYDLLGTENLPLKSVLYLSITIFQTMTIIYLKMTFK